MPPVQAAPASDGAWTLSYLADVSGLIGVVIGLVGFALTIWQLRKTRSAAESAERAAKEARSNLLRVDSIAAISGAIAGLEDIKRLHRSNSWDGMPERYGVQRRMLIAV